MAAEQEEVQDSSGIYSYLLNLQRISPASVRVEEINVWGLLAVGRVASITETGLPLHEDPLVVVLWKQGDKGLERWEQVNYEEDERVRVVRVYDLGKDGCAGNFGGDLVSTIFYERSIKDGSWRGREVLKDGNLASYEQCPYGNVPLYPLLDLVDQPDARREENI